jgi:hypothetical protein
MQNFEERLRTCERQKGRHLSDIIFCNWVINVSNKNWIYNRLFWCWQFFYIENKQSYNYLKNMPSFCATLYLTVHSFSIPPVLFCFRPSLFLFMCLDDLFIYFLSLFFPLLSSVPHFSIFLVSYFITCFRHCATSRKVVSSIPDGVTRIFHWLLSLLPYYGPGVNSASNRNEYHEYLLGVMGGVKAARA